MDLCLSIMFADRIMLTPQFFRKIKGYEREYLSAMLDRYARISELGEKYPGDDFGAALSYMPQFCRSLAKSIDEELYAKLQAIDKPASEEGSEQFIEEIKRYLRN